MKKELKAARLTPSTVDFIANYPTSYRGCEEFTALLEEILRASEVLYNETKIELRGYFTTAEACYLVDLNNAHLYMPQGNPIGSLALNVKDGDFYEGLGEKWSVDVLALINKIEALSAYQAHVVFLLCNEFWNMDDKLRNAKPLKDTVGHIFGAV